MEGSTTSASERTGVAAASDLSAQPQPNVRRSQARRLPTSLSPQIEASRAKARQRSREWYAKNKDRAKAYRAVWREKNRGKLRNYANERYRVNRCQSLGKYGLTIEDYNRMLATQGGGCAICDTPPGKIALSVDHCHATGKVRGLLCFHCNHGLGKFKDDVSLLRGAASYLEASRE